MHASSRRPSAVLRCLALLVASSGCHRALAPLVEPRASAVALTGGPNTSMIYVARRSTGVPAIDLGWTGARGALANALQKLDATPAEVSGLPHA